MNPVFYFSYGCIVSISVYILMKERIPVVNPASISGRDGECSLKFTLKKLTQLLFQLKALYFHRHVHSKNLIN